ncbi:hypothetical protein ABZ341_06955 [Streptomyces sp. NPDC006173]|uniref:hypothetical protein n=1 Tax=Streptomyces sp. NPDC006173 TaxID=3155349 RepID=UPI0033E900A7
MSMVHAGYGSGALGTALPPAAGPGMPLTCTVAELPAAPGPSPSALSSVRSALDGLLGRAVPLAWDDEYYARAATGRVPLTEAERQALGTDAARLPLFG